ncbi:hypothetical protein [Mycolicibacterium celeriflavum]|uniref:Uncharacterized protein n=1 Tax=Mycolicibacterium celeriflavum TaxID=1249101 RepID=A0A1X0BY18_MYCCF|nr:hypothetical protein [Mycolicibacterium celeriflavum]MCV7237310.1 hypothetical protein [Mycolicibacterium celeriflavum]ORA49108.1 hypothetical protein BST21_07605 [Mycolicibacterium celeriflavum]BBY42007.1 hypothetical protein MCEL_03020 [Mycolicibacterium celeriflavum]
MTRTLGVAALILGAVFGAAGVAHGQGDVKHPGTPEGIYTVRIVGQAETTWEIYPICVPTVGDLREPLILPVACRLKVTPKGRGGAEAVQIGGQWTFQANTFNSVRKCPDGSEELQKEIYAFDGITLVGTLKVIHGEVCGEQPGMVEIPMTLTYKEPLAIPVTPYPLICEPGGLRRCF